MSYFNIIKPSSILTPYVSSYTVFRTSETEYDVQRMMPTGCIEVVMYQKGSVASVYDGQNIPHALVGGQMATFLDLKPNGGDIFFISILFKPHSAKSFFGIPISAFYNQIISADDIDDKSWQALFLQIYETEDISKCVTIIENFLINKINPEKTHHLERMQFITDAIWGNPMMEVSDLAKMSCLTEKQFNRVFNAYVGCNPKTYIRIVRFKQTARILSMLSNPNFAQIALQCGYSDQSHMIREYKIFTGSTPSSKSLIKQIKYSTSR